MRLNRILRTPTPLGASLRNPKAKRINPPTTPPASAENPPISRNMVCAVAKVLRKYNHPTPAQTQTQNSKTYFHQLKQNVFQFQLKAPILQTLYTLLFLIFSYDLTFIVILLIFIYIYEL